MKCAMKFLFGLDYGVDRRHLTFGTDFRSLCPRTEPDTTHVTYIIIIIIFKANYGL